MSIRTTVVSVLAIVLAAAAGGCENGFAKCYQGERCPAVASAALVAEQPPQTRSIGRASFVSSRGEGDSQALSAARSVGADYVKWSSEYKGTTQSSGVVPITTPSSNTTYYQGYSQGNVYSRGGHAGSYSGNTYGSATTYGTTTTYVPWSKAHHWMSYSAEFFRSKALDEAKPVQ